MNFNKIFSSMNISGGNIVVNGKRYVGNSVSVVNGKVYVDGKDQTPNAKEIKIEVTADIQDLKVDYANLVNITGNVGNIKSGSGDVNVKGNVTGSVTTGSGDVECGNVGGNVDTGSGDIRFKR
jgi:hypothetical protein